MTVNEAFAFYETDCKLRGVSWQSIALNHYAMNLLSEFTQLDDIPLDGMGHQEVREFLLWVGSTRSGATASRVYDVLSALFRFLAREELLERSPMERVGKPRTKEKVIAPLTEEDVEKILAACKEKTFTGLRDRLVVCLLFDTGLRASELTDIELGDVDLEEGRILVRQGKGDKARSVYFGRATSKLMRKYLCRRAALPGDRLIVTVDGEDVDRHWLRVMLRRLGNRAGLPHVHPHLLRHSCGVAMLRNGSDVFTVQRILGHSTLAMTRHYSQLADRDVQQKHRIYSPSDRLNVSKPRRIISR